MNYVYNDKMRNVMKNIALTHNCPLKTSKVKVIKLN